MIKRNEAAALGKDAVRIVDERGYTNASGHRVELGAAIDEAIRGTVDYTPDDDVPACPTSSSAPEVTVTSETTLQAAQRLFDEGNSRSH